MARFDSRHIPDDDPRAHADFDRTFDDYLEELRKNGFVDPDEIVRDQPKFGQAILEDLELYIGLHPPKATDTPQVLGTLGDYTLRRQIGRGGMGVVYEAWEHSMGRAVALKVLPPAIGADPRATESSATRTSCPSTSWG